MKLINASLLLATCCLGVASCEEQNSVTTGPTRRASHTTSTTTTTVEEPQSVEIATKPGSQNQNSLPHGQPDSTRY